ncbi:5-histidylcysteine sulfoxide synthase [Tatumella sp. JGM118]|uniref:5-histidylcysteine sulfoxide synthase n=1 Tax=Tatumella sp. JGM118 TaxID=2799796 RepID=UPI001BAE8D2E|nr:5-histidylcysteine sulfoxide synthase [Tatumella sp. JGM118]MBS0909470.1 5-histidylcysteine sulfoxide synthase [Tatumella sp. JGM118]
MIPDRQPHLPLPSYTVPLTGENVSEKRQQILEYFLHSWELYESLFECLDSADAWTTKAISLRHPLIFYYAHTATFYINKLMAGGYLDTRIDATIESMMAIGVDEMSWDDLDDQHYSWPPVSDVRAYRQKVKQQVLHFIEEMPLELPIHWDSPAWVILMGIEHERIHLETSSVLIRQLPLSQVKPSPFWPHSPQARHQRSQVPENSLVAIEGSRVSLGKEDETYGWDNEYGFQQTEVSPFQASKMLVSHGEFLTFVQAGGYHTRRFWDEEGWQWREFARAEHPTFWVGDVLHPDQLKLRLMTEEVPMPWDWPAEVNQLEAAAFCRWKAEVLGEPVQLPSETEWYLLRQRIEEPAAGEPLPANINLSYAASPCPVDLFPQAGLYDIVGNVWQWTTTPISGFPGFKVHPLYDDFSTPTFDGKHNLIKGGSFISTGNETLKSARYAFRRHFFQHAGFRYVISSHQETQKVNPYETDLMVSQYLDFQYGPDKFGIANYAKVLAEKVLPWCESRAHALDIGCATGRATFELSRYFSQVTGMDYSARFIDVAEKLSAGEELRYQLPSEGELVDYRTLRLTDALADYAAQGPVHFTQGDACNLKARTGMFDLVFASNLLDRLREPRRFLQDITPMLRTGGVLLLSSPYTWLEEYTPKDNWLGGLRENGEAVTTLQALRRILQADFEEIAPPEDVPFVIRETSRKYQHTVAQLTLWRKK